jgi:ABC-type glutathione transport system ATPase component
LPEAPAIALDRLTVALGAGAQRRVVVDGVSLTIPRGACFGLVGESGSGKSTLLRTLVGLVEGWSGGIAIDGEPVGRHRPKSLHRKMQMVFQDPYAALHPRKTVAQALCEPMAIHGLPDAMDRVRDLLQAVQLPPGCLSRYPNQMSGGQRQRVAIARALVTRPSILLLDEPTSALDVSVQAEVLDLLGRLRDEFDLTYLFVAHDLAVVAQLADRVAVMQSGRVVEEMPVASLRAGACTHAYSRALIAASRPYHRHTALEPRPSSPVLDVEDLTVSMPAHLGGTTLVSGVSFTVCHDRLGLVGESGSGKSLAGRAILGLLPSGMRLRARRMTFEGHDLLAMVPRERAALRGRRMGMVLQDPKFCLNPVMTIGAQIDEVARQHLHLSADAARKATLAMLRDVHIDDPARMHRQYPHEVSGGMGQRAMIAMMLIAGPALLIADEATSALDRRTQMQILAILDELVGVRDMGLLLISHDLDLVRGFCDRVAVMRAGRVIEAGNVSILDNPEHGYTKRLMDAVPRLAVSA